MEYTAVTPCDTSDPAVIGTARVIAPAARITAPFHVFSRASAVSPLPARNACHNAVAPTSAVKKNSHARYPIVYRTNDVNGVNTCHRPSAGSRTICAACVAAASIVTCACTMFPAVEFAGSATRFCIPVVDRSSPTGQPGSWITGASPPHP